MIAATKRLADGLYGVVLSHSARTASDRQAIWTRGRTRKPHECWECGRRFAVGVDLYRSVGNQDYRMRRVCELCMGASR